MRYEGHVQNIFLRYGQKLELPIFKRPSTDVQNLFTFSFFLPPAILKGHIL